MYFTAETFSRYEQPTTWKHSTALTLSGAKSASTSNRRLRGTVAWVGQLRGSTIEPVALKDTDGWCVLEVSDVRQTPAS